MRKPFFLSLVSVLFVAGCAASASRSSASDVAVELPAQSSAAPVARASGGPKCGLAFYGNDYDPGCQLDLDRGCCNPERNCAADKDCLALVECINACPPPKKGACIAACSGNGIPPGAERLDALAECTKNGGMKMAGCDWPVGSGH